MAYIVMVHHEKDSEYLAIWSNVLEAELSFIEYTNPHLKILEYEIIDDDPTEEDCRYLPQYLNEDGKIVPSIKYLLPKEYSHNLMWGAKK